MKYPGLDEGFELLPDSPFYESVTCVCAAMASVESILRADNPLGYKMGDKIRLDGRVQPGVFVYPFRVRGQFQCGHVPPRRIQIELMRIMLLGCYEEVRDRGYHSPIFEFFRHIRNGCSHNNKFYFKNDEPRRPAEWRTLRIDDQLKGGRDNLR